MLCCAQLCPKNKQKTENKEIVLSFKPIVFHKRGVAAHSVARFLNEPPEVLVLAWGLSRSMTEICAQFSLAIYLMILVAGDEVFTECLLYSQLRFFFSHQPKHYFYCSTPEV